MNRRSFIEMLAGAAAAFSLDRERALWVPGEKKIFVPPVIQMVSLNLHRTRECGQWHDGLGGPLEHLTAVPLSQVFNDPVLKRAYEELTARQAAIRSMMPGGNLFLDYASR